MSSRILVTGATGFVGSHLAESLRERDCTVRLLVRNPKKLKWFNPSDYELAIGDAQNEQVLVESVRNVDTVIHCAGVTKTAHPKEFYDVNEVATRRLAKASESAGVRRFVLCSTHAVCGPSGSERMAIESDPEEPITHYGKSKLAGELALKEECCKTDWVILRPPSVMGPRDEQFFPLFRMMWKSKIYTQVGMKVRRYSLIGVHDVVRALVRAAEAESGLRQTYFVAMPQPVAWNAVAQAFAEVTGKTPLKVTLPEFVAKAVGLFGDLSMKLSGKPALLNSEKVREILAAGWICNPAKIDEMWGFRCEDRLEEVVRATFEFYRNENRL
ncbi:MAG: NAD-dependent epimerase/dehydratase family protein [Calditrichaeota bacterium]|nr:NAD-dependent epimerase/dehydratase family protein [Calditrichota bacterium]MCB9368398.1 NAD-dependent epimerase/dehydratase family protein [Calditrichota bacterium]